MRHDGNGSPPTPFAAAEELGGFFVAHAIWSVSTGETLIPMIGYVKDGERTLMRLEGDDMEKIVEEGRIWMDTNPEEVTLAVFIYDGYVRLPTGRTDALMSDIRDYGPPAMSLQVVLPYRSAKSGRFAVHRPKFQRPEGIADLTVIGEAFFRGVNSHEHGARIWNENLDPSI